ncbi:MAG: acetate--CoA ligase family protein [Candidatus Aminicenantes bacterium]|nr:acetate--CoA ligase family protein [Candidatus Aminicenantes bacterium]
MKTKKSALESIFHPKSLAIIGASRQPGSVGHSLLANIIDSRYQGIVYPVNPKANGILGIKCYSRVAEIPDAVDLAVIIVPARLVPSILEECGQKKIKGAIVISAGFKEIGRDGAALEKNVKEIAETNGITLVGPNCLGVINADPTTSLNATFGTSMPCEGNIAFLSQSGALCVAVLDYAREANIGFSKFISMGNKAGVNENEFLHYLKNDSKTDVILMYLEDLADGRKFMTIAREITSHSQHPKPVIALKAGRTVLGAKAVSSHTGSLAGSDKVYNAIFDQSGVLRGDTLEEVFDLVKAFSSQPLPQGKSVALITNSGGPGILATDSCIKHGLSIATFSKDTKKALKKILPPTASINNPVDLIADAQHKQYEGALKEILKQTNVHSSIIILTPTAFTDVEKIATAIVRTTKKFDKPALCCFLGIYDVSKGIEILEKNGIPTYRFPESAAKVLSEMTKFTHWLGRPQTEIKKFNVKKTRAQSVIASVKNSGRAFLMEHEAYKVLKAYGFPVIKHKVAVSESEACNTAHTIGYPVALKIVSPDIIHKFDFGGVIVGLHNKEEVCKAYRQICRNIKRTKPKAEILGVLVEKMAPPGKEVILGMHKDIQFGPILMFGLGGIYVEALEDVTFRLAPIRELTASIMNRKTKTHKILEGFRGEPPYDTEAIADCLKRLSQLVTELDTIKELDINPMIVYPKGKGCRIVDARIIL